MVLLRALLRAVRREDSGPVDKAGSARSTGIAAADEPSACLDDQHGGADGRQDADDRPEPRHDDPAHPWAGPDRLRLLPQRRRLSRLRRDLLLSGPAPDL